MLAAAWLIPPILSLLVLAAHFYRAGQVIAVAVCFATIVLAIIRRRWAARIVQVVLLLGAIEWLRTIYLLAGIRAANELPWMRMAIILGSVALVTALSALTFESRTLRREIV